MELLPASEQTLKSSLPSWDKKIFTVSLDNNRENTINIRNKNLHQIDPYNSEQGHNSEIFHHIMNNNDLMGDNINSFHETNDDAYSEKFAQKMFQNEIR
ncbi:unnamed protein product [Heterobilharzia americana]|nr:unnamed protein product [Heterobilharzia americana]